MTQDILESLRAGRDGHWLNPAPVHSVEAPQLRIDVELARDRFARFAPVLSSLFPGMANGGQISSPLMLYPAFSNKLYVKADHELPIVNSVKGRGGLHEVLVFVERAAAESSLVQLGGDMEPLKTEIARRKLSNYCISVASTGNLGFAVGTVARAFGMQAEVHLSADAKEWKKKRLRAIGVTVVEYAGDYGSAVQGARNSSIGASNWHFVDDERSPDLFAGYAVAGLELAEQLAAIGVSPTELEPLTVYLPCGVGGAPGGILFGLRNIYGSALRAVFVEPASSACFLTALALNGGKSACIYDWGLSNKTIADGLAVAKASEFVLSVVGKSVDAVVSLSEQSIEQQVTKTYAEADMSLEPSAASAIAAVSYFTREVSVGGGGVHVAWTTGAAYSDSVGRSQAAAELA